jgi:hypothetical protein
MPTTRATRSCGRSGLAISSERFDGFGVEEAHALSDALVRDASLVGELDHSPRGDAETERDFARREVLSSVHEDEGSTRRSGSQLAVADLLNRFSVFRFMKGASTVAP